MAARTRGNESVVLAMRTSLPARYCLLPQRGFEVSLNLTLRCNAQRLIVIIVAREQIRRLRAR